MNFEAHSPFSHWSTYFGEAQDYLIDATQRWVLFMDVLRKRGNNYLEYIKDGKPPVLTFDYEILIDGRDLDRPVNYALARIVPPDGVRINPKRRPVVVIDPRAGHGPGIGGSKKDSQIGVAMEQGRQAYFVLFYPDPVPGQTLTDVKNAEALFIEHVAKLHPESKREPAVIGNCQAGWAIALLGADRPDITGPLVLNGSPLSFWSGVRGKNRMRIRGGLVGGVWLPHFLSDLGADKFDGANLVANFEDLNPANTYWTKQYNLYAKVDTEEKRYLEFEKWWNGYFDMTGEEIRFIVGELFVGNSLQKGRLSLDDKIQMKNIDDPMLLFSSSGDNITPPVQALNWIPEVYPTTEDIRRNQKVIIYLIHKNVGHLGIFVSGSVAKKEHNQIIGNLDLMDFMPPGLYEMVIEEGEEKAGVTDYRVRYEAREVEDIRALDDGTDDEAPYPAVAAMSDINELMYSTFVSPWVRLWSTEASAEILRQSHRLRVSRYFFSDLNWGLFPVQLAAPVVKKYRWQIAEDYTFTKYERNTSAMIENSLFLYRKLRDNTLEYFFELAYGNPWAQMFANWYEATQEEDDAKMLSQEDKEKADKADHDHWLQIVDKGGYIEGIIRIMVAVASADNTLDPTEYDACKNRVQCIYELQQLPQDRLKQIVREQSRIVQTDEDRAIRSLPNLLVTREQRTEAVEIADEIVAADNKLHPGEMKRLERIRQVLLGA